MSESTERFLTTVEQKASVSREDAERATRAVLTTLAERISEGEARDIAELLPPELSPWLHTTTPAEGFDVDEFLRRVAGREDVDVATAERHARAVFAALGRIVRGSEIRDLTSELSKDFAPLVAEAEGRFLELVPADVFIQRVADRAGLDPDAARGAIDAVLETLAERIAGGEVDDLIAVLPALLHPPLKRGRERSGRKATRMSLEGFVNRVAQHEGVTPDAAREHARAVFATLREAIPEREFLDVTAQLPAEYAAIEAVPRTPQRSR